MRRSIQFSLHASFNALRYACFNAFRYGALKSLGEKKACFNEYAQQRKNEEKEEARLRCG